MPHLVQTVHDLAVYLWHKIKGETICLNFCPITGSY
nr:MAG TPA: hypothetical protein [Caudoviricetes sp.]DAK72902.1 MAG TPA: hypothetical protein [Caudoviricetes sp.]